MSGAARAPRSEPAGANPKSASGSRSHRRETRTSYLGRGVTGAVAAVKIAACVVAPLVVMLGVLGGIGSFATVRHLATPWFGPSAWMVPVGVDIGILALLAWDLLTEYLGLSWPVLRWTAWAFIAATTYLNIAAAHGNLTASVMHAAMPTLFVTVIEGIRHLIKQCTGLAAGTRIERIPVSRWLLAPRSTFILSRHMVLWHATSYRDGLRYEYQRLQAISWLQQEYGRWLWRWRAPLDKRLALRLTLAAATVGTSDDDAASGPTAELPGRLPGHTAVPPPTATSAPVGKRARGLIEATASILADADRDGAHLSQAALARKLREHGHRVANDRLRWLVAMAREAVAKDAQRSEVA